MSEALLPPLAIAAALMLVAGLAKVRSPGPTQEAFGALGLPARSDLVRGFGLAEACLGALCLALPGRVQIAVLACAYVALAASIGMRWLGGERRAPCGCLGDASAPIHLGHLVLNLACAAAAAAAAMIEPPPKLAPILAGGHPAAALVLLAGIGCSVYLVLALLTLLPESWRAYGAAGDDRGA